MIAIYAINAQNEYCKYNYPSHIYCEKANNKKMVQVRLKTD